MNQKFFELALVIAIVAVIITGFAQTWTSSTNANSYYQFVASSADGKVLMAIRSTEPPLFSTNSGATWNTNASAPIAYTCAAISADGTKLVMPSLSGYIYVSTNTGNTWNQTMAPESYYWQSVACTPDGTKLFAGINGRAIWISTNSGSTWQMSNSGNLYWTSLGTSADGQKIVASGAGQIYVSTNAGSNWRLTTVPGSSVATTPDGGVLAVTGNSSTYISTNFGNTWSTYAVHGASAGGMGNSIAISADGKYLALTDINSQIYTSTNSGATWLTNNIPVFRWYGIASSADGNRLVAVGEFSQIWLGQYTPSPQLKLTPSNGTVGLSWTISSTNYNLQQSPDLYNWSTVTNAPVLNFTNLQNQVSLPASNGSAFFRLKTP